tara:strand:+ start:1021 stop:1158 length:138 start_codon:yes stop_codon:yes gene_type:complete
VRVEQDRDEMDWELIAEEGRRGRDLSCKKKEREEVRDVRRERMGG